MPATAQTEEVKQGHTPGPWTMDRPRDEFSVAHINGKNWWELASVVVRLSGDVIDHPQGCANARLITAAPELLEALQAIVRSAPPMGCYVPLWDRANAAIAKAVQS